MTNRSRTLAAAAALLVALAPAALAGGASARIEGPGKDGRYTVRTYQCSNPSALKVTAWAEGLVDGRRQTVPVTIRRTRARGVYEFTRSWPENGQWVIRMALGGVGAHTPVTVTALAKSGEVQGNQLIWEGDGLRECAAILSGDDPC
jgi:hypothetical protein